MAINEYLNGALNFPKQYLLSAQKPLDSRIVVSTEDQLKVENFVDSKGNKFWYVGMVVSCQENGKVYVLKSETEGFVEVGKETEVPIKSISLNGQVQDIDENGNVELTLSVEDININLDDYYKKSEVYNKTEVDGFIESAIAQIPPFPVTDIQVDGETVMEGTVAKIDLTSYAKSNDVYDKTTAESTFVKQEGYIAYTQDEKDKLAGIAEGAEVNFVKSVGDNLSVDGEGKLTVNIPTVDVPFQSVSESDKILTLENGVLSSIVTFAKETIDSQEYLVVRGKNNEELGKVSTAEFTADSFLDDVTIEGSNIKFTWKMADGSEKTDSVELSNYIKPYNADDTTIELNAETNTFSVKDGVFAKSDDLAEVATTGSYNNLTDKPKIPSIEGLATTTDVENAVADMATKTWVSGELENYAKKTDLFSGSYNDLTDVPTDLVKTDDLDEYAKTTDVETISGKVDTLTTTVGDSTKGLVKDVATNTAAIEALEKLVVGGEGEGLEAILNDVAALKTTVGGEDSGLVKDVADLKGNKQDKLAEGTKEGQILIWTSGNWTPSNMPETLPTEGKEAGKILTVDTDGSKVIWASAPISTTVTKNEATEETVETYTIAQGKTSVNVYSTEQVYTKEETTELVESYFAWHNI